MFSYISLRRVRRYLIIIMTLYMCLFFIRLSHLHKSKIKKHKNHLNLKYVTVHIDLKGAPPKIEFLKNMLHEIKKLGANSLLMEYEDMFPYEGVLTNLSKPQHYNKNELKNFLIEAKIFGLEVIPLVQTFGHMESVLKLPKFKYLREDPNFMDSICPSKLGTGILIKMMLQQVIELHNSVAPLKHIHIGCDEVYKINTCGECKSRKLSSYDLFMGHVNTVTSMVLNLSPSTNILMWDDMLRTINITRWKNFKINPKVDIAYWEYESKKINSAHTSMYFYHKHFKNIWVASAFKGADGQIALMSNYRKRANNTLNWLKFIDNYVFAGENKVYSFRGIILTGWSRYKHTVPLCELLPVSYKCLITALLLVSKFKNGDRIDNIDWSNRGDVIFDKQFLSDYNERVGCKQHGACILKTAKSLVKSIQSYENLLQRLPKKTKASRAWCDKTSNLLWKLEKKLKLKMNHFYGEETIDEFLATRRKNIFKHIKVCKHT